MSSASAERPLRLLLLVAALTGCAPAAADGSGASDPGGSDVVGVQEFESSAGARAGSSEAGASSASVVEAADPSEVEESLRDIEAVRRSYLEHWRGLGRDGVDGLERFARTVQYIVDTRAAMNWSSRDREVRAVLDDLVDLFVGAEYVLEKRMAMSTPSVLGDDAVTEEDGDLSGFAPRFRAGEGRFRHFALNAAASYALPETLVALAAQLRGKDLQTGSTETDPDSAADLATNRIGREFTRLLRKRPLSDLTGDAVHQWLVARFGED